MWWITVLHLTWNDPRCLWFGFVCVCARSWKSSVLDWSRLRPQVPQWFSCYRQYVVWSFCLCSTRLCQEVGDPSPVFSIYYMRPSCVMWLEHPCLCLECCLHDILKSFRLCFTKFTPMMQFCTETNASDFGSQLKMTVDLNVLKTAVCRQRFTLQ